MLNRIYRTFMVEFMYKYGRKQALALPRFCFKFTIKIHLTDPDGVFSKLNRRASLSYNCVYMRINYEYDDIQYTFLCDISDKMHIWYIHTDYSSHMKLTYSRNICFAKWFSLASTQTKLYIDDTTIRMYLLPMLWYIATFWSIMYVSHNSHATYWGPRDDTGRRPSKHSLKFEMNICNFFLQVQFAINQQEWN